MNTGLPLQHYGGLKNKTIDNKSKEWYCKKCHSFFFGKIKMSTKEQLKALYNYKNRGLSEYKTKRDRTTGITTCYLSIQVNGEIMELITERAKQEDDDVDDWIVLQLINALEKPGKDIRPLKEKIDRPGGRR